MGRKERTGSGSNTISRRLPGGLHKSPVDHRGDTFAISYRKRETMIETAYILITLDRGTPAEVAQEVRKIPGIVRADVTMGEFDVIAIAEMEGTKGFSPLASRIKTIAGVDRVVTCVVVYP